MHISKDSYPEYIKNFLKSIIKGQFNLKMDRGFEQALHKRFINYQKAHESILNIINY